MHPPRRVEIGRGHRLVGSRVILGRRDGEADIVVAGPGDPVQTTSGLLHGDGSPDIVRRKAVVIRLSPSVTLFHTHPYR